MALAALPVADIAGKGGGAAAQVAAKALTADIVVINGKYYREIRTREPTGKLTKGGRPQMRTVRRLEPISYDIHVNPVSVLLGAAATLLLGGVGAWMLGLGVQRKPAALVESYKASSATEQDLIDRWTAQLLEDRRNGADDATLAVDQFEIDKHKKQKKVLDMAAKYPFEVENRERFTGKGLFG